MRCRVRGQMSALHHVPAQKVIALFLGATAQVPHRRWRNRIQARLDEQDPILRKVAGSDSSLRIPFILTHQFLGDKPMTIDFAWRTRYLSYPEPFTDYVSGVYETLTKQQRSYWRVSFVIPASTLVQFKVTVQHGDLPPDFDYLGYSVNLGFTFLNPGYSEH